MDAARPGRVIIGKHEGTISHTNQSFVDMTLHALQNLHVSHAHAAANSQEHSYTVPHTMNKIPPPQDRDRVINT